MIQAENADYEDSLDTKAVRSLAAFPGFGRLFLQKTIEQFLECLLPD